MTKAQCLACGQILVSTTDSKPSQCKCSNHSTLITDGKIELLGEDLNLVKIIPYKSKHSMNDAFNNLKECVLNNNNKIMDGLVYTITDEITKSVGYYNNYHTELLMGLLLNKTITTSNETAFNKIIEHIAEYETHECFKIILYKIVTKKSNYTLYCKLVNACLGCFHTNYPFSLLVNCGMDYDVVTEADGQLFYQTASEALGHPKNAFALLIRKIIQPKHEELFQQALESINSSPDKDNFIRELTKQSII